ncbi:sensor domain-containing diguanylate cyclase [Vreelandella populi]|uniref:diguanylate cyclase n=1 Tax=Vreelandella populi TaxID=2498858 RepID=A0A433LAH9_9GAMM|nr:diguanylate cyclase [Halomonas populi]RUR36618.1 diguanylate cyclase [Halomonas populi]RUR45080.1 diguanylate cyclase [Halomonas populi]
MSKWFILPALHKEERGIIGQELKRVERSFFLAQQELLAQARDWANWDDTYEFVQDNYPRYAEVNFSPEMMTEMRYQLIAFFNADGEVYYLSGLAPDDNHFATCTHVVDACAWMAPFIDSIQLSIENNPDQQDFLFPGINSPAMVAITPILRTDSSGPSTGWLAKVRLMDGKWIKQMENVTGLPITIDRQLTAQATPSTTIKGDTIYAQHLLPTNVPAISITVGTQLNRTHYLASLDTIRYVLIWTACLMLFVIGFVLWLMERIILKPLKSLSIFARQTSGENSQLDSALLCQRNDEIGMLARSFDQQLTRQRELNAELLNLSTHDSLTGLPNRRLFDQQLKADIHETQALHQPLAAMMLDIDHFKLFNDHYGHQKGDECLQQVAKALQRIATDHDFLIARTGGEEFSALLPNTSAQRAEQIGYLLHHTVANLKLAHKASPVAPHVTISVGIGSLDESIDISPSALMSNADQALYSAKAAGRHQVIVFKPSIARTSVHTPDAPL